MCDDGVFGVVPFLKASHLEVIVALIVIFDGRPPPLGGRLAGEAKSGDVKSELLRRGCSSATITRSGLFFVRGGLLRVWCGWWSLGMGPWFRCRKSELLFALH